MYSKIYVALSVLLLWSCSRQQQNDLPISTGKLGSLVVVSDAETHKVMNNSIEDLFLSPVPHLPNGEPYFEIVKPEPYDFSRFFFNHKSVLVLVNESNLESMQELLKPFTEKTIEKLMNDTTPVLMNKRDLFAKHQHIVYLFGKDKKDLNTKFLKVKKEILSALMDFEIQDQHDKMYEDTSNITKYQKQIMLAHGMTVQVPGIFQLKRIKEDVFWFQFDATEGETPKNIGLLIHSYPYKDTSDFSYSSIISERDSVCKYLIAGELPGTYMGTTESEYYPPRFKTIENIKGRYAVKIRGWWTIKGLSQAGPFIRYVIHMPEKNRLFVFEGFVYKPNLNTKERDLRFIESIAKSIK